MASRAEGCGQWLSTKNKRTTKLPPQAGGKGKKSKHKGLLNFATSVKRSAGLNIQVSCSPLSPRSRKKLINAKQSKINTFFTTEARWNGSKRDKNVEAGSEMDSDLEGKRARISVKRHRIHDEPCFIGKLKYVDRVIAPRL